jgi:hypothetical protein
MPYLMHAKKAWLSIKTTLVIACPMLVSFYSYPNWGVANHLPPPPMQYVILKLSSISLPWWLGNPLFRHCDTLTCTIRYCNDSPHKRFHIVTIRPHRGRTVQPPPNRSVRPHRSGSKRWLWQSEPRTIRPILCSTRRGGGGGQFGPWQTDGAVKKTALRQLRELHPRMGQPGTSLT